MGVRDWINKNIFRKQQPMLPPANVIRNSKLDEPIEDKITRKRLAIHEFTDTGVTYPDFFDGQTTMKLYTFRIVRLPPKEEEGYTQDLSGIKPYETVSFEAPEKWNIEDAIQKGYIEDLIRSSNAMKRTFNDDNEIENLGRFNSNGLYTQSSPAIQQYIDDTYVPLLREKQEQERLAAKRAEDPGFIIRTLGKIIYAIDDIREARTERRKARRTERRKAREAREAANSEAPSLTREEKGLSPNEICMVGKNSNGLSHFRIGNPEERNIRAITLTNVERLSDREYLYTAFNEWVGSFESHQTLASIPNVQFVLPIAPENFDVFLKSLDDPANANAKNNMDALMELFEKEPMPNKGLFVGGLNFRESDFGLQYDQRLNIANMLAARYNGNRGRHQQPDRSSPDYQL